MVNVEIVVGGDLRIGVYVNGTEDLTKLDLKFLNLRFINIRSEEFKNYIRSISVNDYIFSTVNFKTFQILIEQHWSFYALIPIELRHIDESIFEQVEQVVLIINPSYFKLHSTITYEYESQNDKTHFILSSELLRNYFSKIQIDLTTLDFELANQFIKRYFDKVNELKYLRIPIQNYVKNFIHANKEGHQLSYTILCICLEALIQGRSEIMYKIQRLCAVLNSENIESGNLIFKNIRYLYDLRSEIVHGENINYKFYEEYWQYLLYLVSRTLIELIASDIKDVSELNLRVTQLGFGQVKTITNNDQRYIFDKDVSRIILKELPKYKPINN